MKYMLQIYLNDSMARLAELPDEEQKRVYAEYVAISRTPAVIDGHQLQPPTTAITVRVHDGTTVTADGPIAAAKDSLGGYYLIEADHPSAAIELAARIPAARMGGTVEVRAVIEP